MSAANNFRNVCVSPKHWTRLTLEASSEVGKTKRLEAKQLGFTTPQPLMETEDKTLIQHLTDWQQETSAGVKALEA